MRVKRSPSNAIDMTLRVWSNTISLKAIVAAMTRNVGHLHVKGQPMATEGPAAGRLANRHYASIANAHGKDGHDVNAWLRTTSNMVGTHLELTDFIRAGKAEALYWVAILGGEPLAMPQIDPSLVSLVASQNAQILLENYTMESTENSVKLFLPAKLSLSAAPQIRN